MKEILLLWILCCIICINCSRILIIPFQGKSLMIATNALGQELKKNGHEIYTLAEPHFKGLDNEIGAEGLNILYYDIEEGTMSLHLEKGQKALIDVILNQTHAFTFDAEIIFDACNNMMADKAFLETVSSLKFDLAIVQGVPFMPCAYLLPHIFKIPHVTFTFGFSLPIIPGSVMLPSYTPSMYLEKKSKAFEPLTFPERLINTLFYIGMKKEVLPLLSRLTDFLPGMNDLSLIEEYRKKGMVADHIHAWLDFFDESQLFVIGNADLTFEYPKPLFPNVISVDGLSTKEAKPLSKEIEELVQTAEHGIIIASFGSLVNAMPDEYIIKIVNAFRKRKELFIMRHSRSLRQKNFSVPSNVKFLSWLPQIDLLAHNKTKLFITHGGINGLLEAVYHGVPMLYGLNFKLLSFTEEEVVEKIEEIVTNPSYREETQRAGEILRHRPMGARETAAFWIEYVLKFDGEHLRPPTINLTWWQLYCLDTLGLLTFIVLLILCFIFVVLKCVVKTIFKMFSSKKHEKEE